MSVISALILRNKSKIGGSSLHVSSNPVTRLGNFISQDLFLPHTELTPDTSKVPRKGSLTEGGFLNLSRLSELSAATVFTSRMTKHLRLNVLCAVSITVTKHRHKHSDILNVEIQKFSLLSTSKTKAHIHAELDSASCPCDQVVNGSA